MKFLGTPWNGASTNAITLTSTRPPMKTRKPVKWKTIDEVQMEPYKGIIKYLARLYRITQLRAHPMCLLEDTECLLHEVIKAIRVREKQRNGKRQSSVKDEKGTTE